MEKLTIEIKKEVYDELFYIVKVLNCAKFIKSGRKDENTRKAVALMLGACINGQEFGDIIKPLKTLAENTERVMREDAEIARKKD